MLLNPAFVSQPELEFWFIRNINTPIAETWDSTIVERLERSNVTYIYEKVI